MAVYDRWHLSHPPEGAQPCKCGRGKNKLYPSADHGCAKRWQVRWRDHEGKQRKRNFAEKNGDDPERHAAAFDAKVNADLDAGTYVAPELGRITLEEWARQWRAGQAGDPATLETLDKHLAHVVGSPIGGRALADLSRSPSAIQQWIKGLEDKGLSAIYMRAIKHTLSTVLAAAVDDGRIPRNPVRSSSVRLPKVPERRIRPWTLEMITAAREEIDRRCASPAMVDLAAAAGLRESEVFAFAEEDIVWLGADRKILVRRQIKRIRDASGAYRLVYALPKHSKEREVPLSDTLAEQIAKRSPVPVTLPWGRPDGKGRTYRLLFVKADGGPWYRQAFQHTWEAARKAAEAPPSPDPGGRFHVLRHTFASIQLAGGADVLKLAAWLGHSDPGFTLRTYAHLMPDTRDVGRRAVDNFFAGRPSALDVPSEGRG